MNFTSKKLNIVMAGGGTGGHVFPIKSMIECLDTHHHYSTKIAKIYRFGSRNSLESKTSEALHTKHTALRFIPILSGKYRRETPFKSRLKNIRDLFLFLIGLFQSIFWLILLRADVIFCKGGYVALPVVIAGFLLRKKIIVHESDTHPGMVNQIASRFAAKVFTGFDKVLPKSQTIGQLLSDDIVFDGDITALASTQLQEVLSKKDPKKTMVLVVGGSQGSHRLYKSLLDVLHNNPDIVSNFVFCLSLGISNSDLKHDFKHFSDVFVFDFLTQKEMGILCYYSDIGLTRGGTTSLAEQKLYDVKLLIVPISWTHDQYDNAKYYVQQYQDLLIDQKNHRGTANSDFEERLAQALRQHVGYYKTSTPQDLLHRINQAKNAVANAIIGE